jgi:hypothetical protein
VPLADRHDLPGVFAVAAATTACDNDCWYPRTNVNAFVHQGPLKKGAFAKREETAMPDKLVEVTPRSFNPMSIPGLSNRARDAVNAAFDAMSSWRNETADASERHSKQVIEKMAAAAAALGWPEQIVDAARTQMQGITEMQIKTIDHMMDAWEEQLKLPNPMTASPSAMLSKLKSLPSFGAAGSWPGDPMQLWMQFAKQWQKSWTDAMSYWEKAGKLH